MKKRNVLNSILQESYNAVIVEETVTDNKKEKNEQI